MVILGDNQITCLFYFTFSKLNYAHLDSLRFRLGPPINNICALPVLSCKRLIKIKNPRMRSDCDAINAGETSGYSSVCIVLA